MRNLETIQQDIERCQNQIASTYNSEVRFKDENERKITREGFQLQLHKLFHEKAMQLPVREAVVVFPNGSEECVKNSAAVFKRRTLETCNYTIQQVKSIRD